MSRVTTDAATAGRFRSQLGLLVAVTAGAIGVIYGYDTGVVAGALLFVPKQFHLSTSGTSSIATAVAIGMIVGALVASRLSDAIGRQRTMVAIAAGYVVFAALSGAANGLVWLDTARFFLGVTIGLSTVTAPVFIAESSPPRIRGALVVSYQVATVAGIMSAYFIDYGLATVGAWRWMFAAAAVPAGPEGVLQQYERQGWIARRFPTLERPPASSRSAYRPTDRSGAACSG